MMQHWPELIGTYPSQPQTCPHHHFDPSSPPHSPNMATCPCSFSFTGSVFMQALRQHHMWHGTTDYQDLV